MEFDFIIFKMLDSNFSELFSVNEPLAFEGRFNDGATFVAVRNGVGDFLFAEQELLILKIFKDFLATFFSG